ncbi:unnamed protein product [Withania somnifera]
MFFHSSDLGIERSMFNKPRSFHLTVLMLKLSNDQIEAAAQVLLRVSPKVTDALERRPVSLRLKGLDCMRGSPEKAYVVYAPVEVTGEVIINAFTEAGLVLEKDANQKLKLHATMMNAGFRKRLLLAYCCLNGSKNKSGKTEPFDARTIFGHHGSEDWGECHIREARLSQRFQYDGNGYFHCCASIPFPEEKQKNFFQKMFSMGK